MLVILYTMAYYTDYAGVKSQFESRRQVVQYTLPCSDAVKDGSRYSHTVEGTRYAD